MKVKDVMTKEVVTISPEDTLLEASLKMSQKRISGAPVVNEDNLLLGMLSEADILGSIKTTVKTMQLIYPSLSSLGVSFKENVSEKEAIEAYRDVEKMKVSEIMTKDVYTIDPDEELRNAIKKMVNNRINRLPVIDANEKLVGIITRGDILRGIAEESKNNSSQAG